MVFADLDIVEAQRAANKSSEIATNPLYRALVIAVDVADSAQVQEMVSQTLSTFGKIDYNVNCAGVGDSEAFFPILSGLMLAPGVYEDCNFFREYLPAGVGTGQPCECSWHLVLHAGCGQGNEVSATLDAPRSISPKRRGKGIDCQYRVYSFISNRSWNCSVHDIKACHARLDPICRYGLPRLSRSSVTNGNLKRSIAVDFAPEGIRVNAVCPSWVNTPMINTNNELAQVCKRLNDVVPLGRIAEPEEIADVALYLCSPMASYVTGCAWMADGGFTCSAKL